MDKFVVGFAFTADKNYVLLINKTHPPWQAGHLNGIGGHIEDGESETEAMNRECLEECGLIMEWQHRGIMTGVNNDGSLFNCHIFYAYDDAVFGFQQLEEEAPMIIGVKTINKLKTIANLSFLIPYGTCLDGSDFITVEYIRTGGDTEDRHLAEQRGIL